MITATEHIKAILSNPANATMTLQDIVAEEIKQFKQSEKYKTMCEAEQYYRNRTEIQHKTNRFQDRSNSKIEHPILRKVVDQKTDYLLAKAWSIDTADESYADALNDVFDHSFRRKIKSLGKGAIKSGIAWLQPYFAKDKLQFMRLPSTEVIPIWADEEHTELEAFIRFYVQDIYEGHKRKQVIKAEFWDTAGVKRFVEAENGFVPDTAYGTPENNWTEPHFFVGETAYNWAQTPVVWLKYNEEELPLHYYIKDLIDDINWQTSVTADVLRDVAKFIFVLRGYGGQDLAEFVRDLQQSLAINVANDGGVDKLQADIDIDAVMAFLEKQRRDIYDYASAVDTKDPDLGSASGTAIHFRYMGLDNDAEALALELQETFARLKLFVDTHLQLTTGRDYTASRFSVVYNKDLPANEQEIVQSITALAGGRTVVSRRTLIGQLPFIKDVDAELEQIEAEQQEAEEMFGAAMFPAAPVPADEE